MVKNVSKIACSNCSRKFNYSKPNLIRKFQALKSKTLEITPYEKIQNFSMVNRRSSNLMLKIYLDNNETNYRIKESKRRRIYNLQREEKHRIRKVFRFST